METENVSFYEFTEDEETALRGVLIRRWNALQAEIRNESEKQKKYRHEALLQAKIEEAEILRGIMKKLDGCK